MVSRYDLLTGTERLALRFGQFGGQDRLA